MGEMRIRLPIVAALLAGALAALAQASSGTDGSAISADRAAHPTASTATVRGPKLAIVKSSYGKVLANGRGRALYLFTADSGKTSDCYGECARVWPPYIVKSKPRAVDGAKPGLVGTTRRADGRLQATYAGHPVYYYIGDNAPREVTCQAVEEFGGIWYVLRANGATVR
jgi:predicted lipoprotein with Yx(FWY)xxD motif